MTREWARALVAAVVLASLVFAGLRVAEWKSEAVGQENMDGLTEALFTTYVLPFEVLSVLLLGALIAALYVGAKQRREPGAGSP